MTMNCCPQSLENGDPHKSLNPLAITPSFVVTESSLNPVCENVEMLAILETRENPRTPNLDVLNSRKVPDGIPQHIIPQGASDHTLGMQLG